MSEATPIKIDPLSFTCLYLKLQVNKLHLGTATGFVVTHKGQNFLVTNWHVFSDRHAETGRLMSRRAAIPDEVRIAHNTKRRIATICSSVNRLFFIGSLSDCGSHSLKLQLVLKTWAGHPLTWSSPVSCHYH